MLSRHEAEWFHSFGLSDKLMINWGCDLGIEVKGQYLSPHQRHCALTTYHCQPFLTIWMRCSLPKLRLKFHLCPSPREFEGCEWVHMEFGGCEWGGMVPFTETLYTCWENSSPWGICLLCPLTPSTFVSVWTHRSIYEGPNFYLGMAHWWRCSNFWFWPLGALCQQAHCLWHTCYSWVCFGHTHFVAPKIFLDHFQSLPCSRPRISHFPQTALVPSQGGCCELRGLRGCYKPVSGVWGWYDLVSGRMVRTCVWVDGVNLYLDGWCEPVSRWMVWTCIWMDDVNLCLGGCYEPVSG